MYDNQYISQQLKLTGKLLEIQGENPFKTRAYSKGAEIFKTLETPVGDLIANNTLGDIPGIGDALRTKVIAMHETGTFPLLDRLLSEIPAGVVDMLRIKGMGPKKIADIWLKMGITTMGELLYACTENRLIEVKGFGEKTQEKIRATIEYLMANEHNFHYARIFPYAEAFANLIKADLGEDAQFGMCGDLRRKLPVLDGLDFIAHADLQGKIRETLAQKSGEMELMNETDDLWLIHPADTSIPIRLHFTSQNFWLALWKKTGSEAHLEGLSPDSSIDFDSEEAIYAHLGLKYIEPELREGLGEIELARADKLPTLITREDIKGMVHNHSNWSDGRNSLEAMALAAKNDMGSEYLIITDHSKSAFYANGLTAERVAAQHKEIDALNEKLAPFKILKGIESDILSDGSLDYPDEVLATFDCVIASVHSILNMDEERATKRLITAIENPYTDMLGHPTGRLLLTRAGYPINHRAVIDACAANGVMIEINANPNRLDLDWKWVPYALEKGILISVNPDAHKVEGYLDTWWGIEVARKGYLTAEQCFNAKSLAEVEAILARKRSRTLD